jgi:hypothetical protein
MQRHTIWTFRDILQKLTDAHRWSDSEKFKPAGPIAPFYHALGFRPGNHSPHPRTSKSIAIRPHSVSTDRFRRLTDLSTSLHRFKRSRALFQGPQRQPAAPLITSCAVSYNIVPIATFLQVQDPEKIHQRHTISDVFFQYLSLLMIEKAGRCRLVNNRLAQKETRNTGQIRWRHVGISPHLGDCNHDRFSQQRMVCEKNYAYHFARMKKENSLTRSWDS